MEHLQYIVSAISYCSIAVISYGTIMCLIQFVRFEISRKPHAELRKLRTNLGSYLLLGLELLIAADIIETVLKPYYEELLVLAGVVVLRTVLSLFLNKEIKELEELENNNKI